MRRHFHNLNYVVGPSIKQTWNERALTIRRLRGKAASMTKTHEKIEMRLNRRKGKGKELRGHEYKRCACTYASAVEAVAGCDMAKLAFHAHLIK